MGGAKTHLSISCSKKDNSILKLKLPQLKNIENSDPKKFCINKNLSR